MRRHPTLAAEVQELEARRLLAADLVGAFKSYALPANAAAGQTIKGTAMVTISNKDAKALPCPTLTFAS